MPELPEVHTTIQSLLKAGLIGCTIHDVYVEWPRTVGGNPAVFRSSVIDRRIEAVRRRGKYILIRLQPAGWLVVHLRMSGRLLLTATEPGEYVRSAVKLSDTRWLCLYAPRRFARMEYADSVDLLDRRLGVEPLSEDFDAEELMKLVVGRRTAIKAFLLDQTCIAGIGNIYADESLFTAGIHPLTETRRLKKNDCERLSAAIREVLQRGIGNLGTSLGTGKSNFSLPSGETGRNQEDIRVFRRTGLPCIRCGTPIKRSKAAQRSTHFCPVCQPSL